jgi:hypothetical protein
VQIDYEGGRFMFVSISLTPKKKVHRDLAIDRFKKFSESTRDFEIRKKGSKDVEFLFRTDEIGPFIEFVKQIAVESDSMRYVDISYDDGDFHYYEVQNGQLVNTVDTADDRLMSGYLFLQSFTGIRDNVNRVLRIWANEIKPSQEDLQQKKEDLQKGKAAWEEWDRAMDERFQRKMEKRAQAESDDEAHSMIDRVKTVAYPKGRKSILDFVHQLNTSGSAFVPVIIFPNEISSKLSQEGLSKFASYFDKTEEKAKTFSMILEAFKHYKET